MQLTGLIQPEEVTAGGIIDWPLGIEAQLHAPANNLHSSSSGSSSGFPPPFSDCSRRSNCAPQKRHTSRAGMRATSKSVGPAVSRRRQNGPIVCGAPTLSGRNFRWRPIIAFTGRPVPHAPSHDIAPAPHSTPVCVCETVLA